jgi:tetratricopeptide (TPR) repeat protein
MAEEKTKLKRYWSEQAVALALQGRWSDAVTANQNILALFPSDAEAYNRLGKAFTELGKYADARDSYNHTLQIDPGNGIAEKNLQRLEQLASMAPTETPVAVPLMGDEYLAPALFIEEMGKTATTTLINPAGLLVLAKQSAGDPVRLRQVERRLVVENVRGERLGEIEPKLAQRLIGFINAGNRYAAAISSLDMAVRVIIREMFQHPSQVGRVSFPAKGGDSSFRSYIKDSVLKYDLDEDDDDGDERESAPDGDGAGEDAADEPEGFDDDMSGNPPDDK